MRVRFNWPSGAVSLFQNDLPARIEIEGILRQSSLILVNGEQVWPLIVQEVQREAVPFPIGTRVRLREDIGPEHEYLMGIERIGQVVHYEGDSVGVVWEDWFGGHGCDRSTGSSGWYIRPEHLVAAPLPQTTTPTYTDCEAECAGCGDQLGSCSDWDEYQRGDGRSHRYCLDSMWEGDDGRFYHDGCQPADEEEETPPPAFQVGDEVVVTREVGTLVVGHWGTVRVIDSPNRCGVEFPGLVGFEGGHTLGGVLPLANGFYCTNDTLARR